MQGFLSCLFIVRKNEYQTGGIHAIINLKFSRCASFALCTCQLLIIMNEAGTVGGYRKDKCRIKWRIAGVDFIWDLQKSLYTGGRRFAWNYPK